MRAALDAANLDSDGVQIVIKAINEVQDNIKEETDVKFDYKADKVEVAEVKINHEAA